MSYSVERKMPKRAKKTPKGHVLYPSKEQVAAKLARDPEVKLWLSAIDDIVASVLAHYIDVPAYTFAGRTRRGFRRYTFQVNEQRLRVEANATRRALMGLLPEAIQHFQKMNHQHGPGCRCRAYLLLRYNAYYAAKVIDGDPHEMAADNKDAFDAFMAARI